MAASRGGLLFGIYELRPTRSEYGHTGGHELDRISMDWFSNERRSYRRSGFYEIDAELTAEI
jgi:hypothetical protein